MYIQHNVIRVKLTRCEYFINLHEIISVPGLSRKNNKGDYKNET